MNKNVNNQIYIITWCDSTVRSNSLFHYSFKTWLLQEEMN